MKTLVALGNGKLELRDDVPLPRPGDYGCLVKNVACGICNGTDLKLRDGKLRHFGSYPAVIGHESTGVVVEAGCKVRYYQPGDLVLRSGLDDMPGLFSLWGAFAEYGRVMDCRAMREDGIPYDEGMITQQVVPKGIDPVDAVMLITLKETYSALDRLGLGEGARAAVVGDGPVGLALMQLLKLRGARFVALSGHHDVRLEIARRLGADLALNSAQQDFAAELAARGEAPLDAYVDAVGRMGNLGEALRLIREDGLIALYGIGLERDVGLDWYAGPYNWRLHSVQWPIPSREYAAHDPVVNLALEGRIDLKDYVTHRLPIGDFAEGFRLVERREALKAALVF